LAIGDAATNRGGFPMRDLKLPPPRPGEVQLWDTKMGALKRTFPSSHVAVRQLAFSANGRRLAVWTAKSFKGHVELMDLASGRLLVAFDDRFLASFGSTLPWLWLNQDASRFLTAKYLGKNIEIRNTADGKLVRQITSPEKTHLTGLACSFDGRIIAAGVGGPVNQVVVWFAADGRKLLAIDEREPITKIAFSEDGRFLAYGNGKCTVVVELKSKASP